MRWIGVLLLGWYCIVATTGCKEDVVAKDSPEGVHDRTAPAVPASSQEPTPLGAPPEPKQLPPSPAPPEPEESVGATSVGPGDEANTRVPTTPTDPRMAPLPCHREDGPLDPPYEGLIGYVVGKPENPDRRRQRPPWYAPRLKQIGPTKFERSGRRVKHKTEVEVVRAAIPNTLSRWTYGGLLVRDVSKPGSEPFWIYAKDFSLVPHWDCGLENLRRYADKFVLARTLEEVRGVTSSGDWVDVPKGARVICDKTGLYREMGGDIACYVYKQYRYRYGGIPVSFESDSLEVLY